MELHVLTRFFRTYGGTPQDQFLGVFPGAFVLVRFKGGTPLLGHLPPEGSFKVTLGSDEDCDLEFDADPTLDGEHAILAYHLGFQGWTVEDLGTSFGTHVDATRLNPRRPTLLQDRNVIKPGGGLTELQFYKSESLYKRMAKAGITRSMSRRKLLEKKAVAKETGKMGIVAEPHDDETRKLPKPANLRRDDGEAPTTRYKPADGE